jgi:hypothetical protein
MEAQRKGGKGEPNASRPERSAGFVPIERPPAGRLAVILPCSFSMTLLPFQKGAQRLGLSKGPSRSFCRPSDLDSGLRE